MPIEIVDSHQHFWQLGCFDYPWLNRELGVLYRDYLPPAFAPVLNQSCVAKTVLVQASNSLSESRWLLNLADSYPFIAGVVGWVDLMDLQVEEQLQELIGNAKFKGVRHLVVSCYHMAKLPISSRAISRWAEELKAVAIYPNVHCKLSGLVTEADHLGWKLDDLRPYVECALEFFGSERLMFGSDYPVCLLAALYDRVLGSFQEL